MREIFHFVSFGAILVLAIAVCMWLILETPMGGFGSVCAVFIVMIVYALIAELHPMNKKDDK